MDHDNLNKFSIPINRRLHMKCEENWPRDFRGEVIQRCLRTEDGQQVITIPAHIQTITKEPAKFQIDR